MYCETATSCWGKINMICILLTSIFPRLHFWHSCYSQKYCKTVHSVLQAKTTVSRAANTDWPRKTNMCVENKNRCNCLNDFLCAYCIGQNVPQITRYLHLRLCACSFGTILSPIQIYEGEWKAGHSSCSQSNEALADSRFTHLQIISCVC